MNAIIHDVLAEAKEDHESVIELTRDLVAIPSRGGLDPYEPVLDRIGSWLAQRGLPATVLKDSTGATVGLTCEVSGSRPGPRWVLDACLDTAPFGDEHAWTHAPTAAVIENGWLYGRGSADSKSGAAIFCHIAARLATITDQLRGSMVLLFDVDEHTGGFGGARRYFEGPDAPHDVAGVMIGYPGMDKLVVGGRGVHRAKLHVHGVASHSGGSKTTPSAIEKAADLIRALSTAELPDGASAGFPLTGKLTVTSVQGGGGYSVTPDLCTLNVDIRTTPTFHSADGARFLERLVAEVDDAWPGTRPTLIQVDTRWPAYALAEDSRLRTALLDAANSAGIEVKAKVAGPSNIGNYLAGLGIPATAGFGVAYIGLHGTDERIQLDTIPTVQAIYHAAALTLLGA
ncbi:M20 family metallopeptidase [Streptoalloteichus hindustanus]|uniref:Succinyl-diaminopimelate desuccinylase n=1 Tax=Streptoalloteichus hindustanus TaxID=2017 RepID=A0A1M5MS21_STRHI|nr:M20/M25/M40 family metallo-hydrolase [Streptoalloteichus hindustanus]SHG79583.1 succinyl-diaminopimelate desuccinylase [Streptoalloteichus hindustanus]